MIQKCHMPILKRTEKHIDTIYLQNYFWLVKLYISFLLIVGGPKIVQFKTCFPLCLKSGFFISKHYQSGSEHKVDLSASKEKKVN